MPALHEWLSHISMSDRARDMEELGRENPQNLVEKNIDACLKRLESDLKQGPYSTHNMWTHFNDIIIELGLAERLSYSLPEDLQENVRLMMEKVRPHMLKYEEEMWPGAYLKQ